MFDSATKCLQSTRFPVLCLVLIMVMNGLAAWSVPPLSPVLIGFDKDTIQVREGDTHNLSVELDPLPTADVQVVLEWDGPEHGTCWQFGDHRDLAISGDGRWVLRIPEGRRTLTLPIRFIDDENEKPQPDVLKINLLHVTENTKPGGFNETRFEIKDAYIAPVIEIAPDATLQVREGNVLTLPIIAHGKVDLPISVPFVLRGAAKDIKGEPANTISFREGSNHGTIDLNAGEDRLYEGEENFSLRLEEGEQYVLGDRREIEFTVIDGDSPPVYQIDAAQSVFGHDEPVRVRLRANIPSSEETRIDYTLEPDSVLPVDILPPDKRVGQFIVPAGKEDVLHAMLDPSTNWPRGNHALKVKIDPERVNGAGHDTASFTVTHTPAAVTPSAASLAEGDTRDQTFKITLPDGIQGAKTTDVHLRFSGSAVFGKDYEIIGGLGSAVEGKGDQESRFEIPEGQGEVSFLVRVIDDATYEGEKAERLEIEIVEASAGIDVGKNVAVLTIKENEKAPPLQLNWQGENPVSEGESGRVVLSIPETSQVAVPITGMLQFSGDAKEGKDFEIDSKSFRIGVGEKMASLDLRVIDDHERDWAAPLPKSLAIGVDSRTVSNANLDSLGDLGIRIKDDDDWEGANGILLLVAMTEAWKDKGIQDKLKTILNEFANENGHRFIGGGVQWFDSEFDARKILPRTWNDAVVNDAALIPDLDTNAVLGAAQKFEEEVLAGRDRRPFSVILIYPLAKGGGNVPVINGEAFTFNEGQNRHVIIVGRSMSDFKKRKALYQNIKAYSGLDENDKDMKENVLMGDPENHIKGKVIELEDLQDD